MPTPSQHTAITGTLMANKRNAKYFELVTHENKTMNIQHNIEQH